MQPVVGLCDARNDRQLDRLIGLELGVGSLRRDLGPERSLAWIRELLREAESRIAGGFSADAGKRSWAAVAVVADREHGIGQTAFLPRPLPRRLVPLLRRLDLGITSE